MRILIRTASAVLLGAALVAGTAGCSDDEAPTPTSTTGVAITTQHLDVATFAERVAEPGVAVLDVRTPKEFADGHLPDAINIDITASDAEQRLSELDRTTTYAVYCRSGHRSGQAVAFMAENGFADVADLTGGLTAWIADGGTVVTGG